MSRYAAFVSPHGYGHAARASAVMAAVHRLNGGEFEIFTTAPRWFYEGSLPGGFGYHEVECDVGFRQVSALVADLEATVQALGRFIPFDSGLVDRLADIVLMNRCQAVLCDISPLGIAVAAKAGVPSLLVESFIWPWLYGPFHDQLPELVPLSAELDRWWGMVDVHVQTEPLCWRDPDAYLVGPISRLPRLDREEARAAFGLPADADVVAVTMGGYREEMPFLDRLQSQPDIVFVVAGAPRSERIGNVFLFEDLRSIFLPDLIRACDGLVGKLGYSVVAEAWRDGIPFIGVGRTDSREMDSLEAFTELNLSGFQIDGEQFKGGDWIDRVPGLLELPRRPYVGIDAADEVADMLVALG